MLAFHAEQCVVTSALLNASGQCIFYIVFHERLWTCLWGTWIWPSRTFCMLGFIKTYFFPNIGADLAYFVE